MAEAILALVVGTFFLGSSLILRGKDPGGMLAVFGGILLACGLTPIALELL